MKLSQTDWSVNNSGARMSQESKKHKILKAARELFVVHGYAGTSIGKIAKLAGVNHSLIFHHFNNKDQLWLAVKLEILNKSEQVKPIIPKTTLPLHKFLSQAYRHLLDFYQNHPDIVRLIYWQRLEVSDQQYVRSSNYNDWVIAIKDYQTQKIINPSLRADFVASSIISSACSLGLDKYVLLGSSEDIDDYIEFCIEGFIKMFQA